MGTTAASFYPVSGDQDQAWGTDVRKLNIAVGTTFSTTIASHPSAAGTTDITLDPATTRSTQGDVSADFGWAINQAGATDGVESTATEKRMILAGTWLFRNRVTTPATGAVTGVLGVTPIYKVYRVATGGGARTLLFTVTGAETLGAALGGVLTIDTTSASQASIVLEAGETIHVGYISRLRQVAGTFGAVAGTLTWHFGASSDAYVELPPPGVRTQFLRTHTGSSGSSGALRRQPTKALTASIASSAILVRQAQRKLLASITPTGALTKTVTKAAFLATITSSGLLRRTPQRSLSSSISPGPGVLAMTPTKALTASISSTSTVRFAVARKFVGAISPSGALTKSISKAKFLAAISSSGTAKYQVQKLFTATIGSTGSLNVLLVKNFKGTITSSSTLSKGLFLKLAGALSSAGSLRRLVSKKLTARMGPQGDGVTIVKKIIAIFDD